MKQFVQAVFRFLFPVFLLLILLVGFNCWLDPYGVIRGDMTFRKIEPNQRYLKVKHLINHPGKYNSFLFGSSRTGKIDVTKIRDSNKWYNMSYSEGVPAESLEDIKFLLKNNVSIKNLLLGVDNLSYLISPALHTDQSLRKRYLNKFNPLWDYLILRPSKVIIDEYFAPDTTGFVTFYDIYNSGAVYVINKDDYINAHPLAHKREKHFNKPTWTNYYSNRSEQTLAEIREIAQICSERNIKLKVFVNPMHVKTYLRLDMDDYFTFLYKLSSITSFYDFSGINEITTDNFNYYETSHYRTAIGDTILQYIFEKTQGQHFGRLVNWGNIESVLKEKKVEILEYDKRLN